MEHDSLRTRAGGFGDIERASAIWEDAHAARLGFVPAIARREHNAKLLESRIALPASQFRVCEASSHAVGMVLGSLAHANDGVGDPLPDVLHVSYMAVDPKNWGRGIASLLLEDLATVAVAAGYRRLQLWVANDNDRARNLYERMGYLASGRKKAGDGGVPIVHYERVLTQTAIR